MPRRRSRRDYHGVRWVDVGSLVRFDPLGQMQFNGSCFEKGSEVTGTVVYINKKHKWFSVVYGNQRTSFLFADVGQAVTVIG